MKTISFYSTDVCSTSRNRTLLLIVTLCWFVWVPQVSAENTDVPVSGETAAPVSTETTVAPSEHTVTHQPRVFKRLWGAYPNKSDREGAIEAWNNLKVSDEELAKMRQSFPMWRDSGEWRKQRGRNVPTLATWLNERMWEKEAPPQAPLTVAEISSFLVQPLYLGPRIAYAIGGSIVGGVVYPFNHEGGSKIIDSSLNSTWAWHEFISPDS